MKPDIRVNIDGFKELEFNLVHDSLITEDTIITMSFKPDGSYVKLEVGK